MQLGKLENKAYETIRMNAFQVFRVKDLCLLMKIDRTKAYNIVKALKKKNIIKNIGKGFFAFNDTEEFAIATAINYPSYISFWSALNYYGFSDQTPRKIFIATSRYSKQVNNFKYITLSKKRFFGYTKIGHVAVAEKEKAIIDSLLFPKYSGGINEIIKCFQVALSEISTEKLADYAIKTESKAVLRRLGFILENLTKKKFEKLRKKIGKGYELLDPSLKRKNNLNARWLLDINTE